MIAVLREFFDSYAGEINYSKELTTAITELERRTQIEARRDAWFNDNPGAALVERRPNESDVCIELHWPPEPCSKRLYEWATGRANSYHDALDAALKAVGVP